MLPSLTCFQGKPRGYAFIEYEEERSVKEAFDRADGRKIDGRRVLVDVERGRTVKGWKPRSVFFPRVFPYIPPNHSLVPLLTNAFLTGALEAAKAARASLKRRNPRRVVRGRVAAGSEVAVVSAARVQLFP